MYMQAMVSTLINLVSCSSTLALSSSYHFPSFPPVLHHGLKLSHGGSLDAERSCFTPHRFYIHYAPRLPMAPVFSSSNNGGVTDSVSGKTGTYKVSDFMTKKKDLYVVKSTTTVDEALQTLVRKRISGFPVIDDGWNLVGVVSDYDLLALDSISGGTQNDTNMFPEVDSSWKAFNEIQKLLNKTKGQVVGDVMTPTPLVVEESAKLEDAAKLLLETKYRRLPVVDSDGKLVGLITRGAIVRAALLIKRATEGSM